VGAFFLVTKPGRDVRAFEYLCDQMLDQFERQGFASPHSIRTGDFDLYLYKKLNTEHDNLVEYDSGDFCACVGTLLYRGKVGSAALEEFYRDFSPGVDPMERLYGAYCVIIRKQGRVCLMVDRLGIFKAYSDRDGTIWSSSMLALAATADEPLINPQCVYEYVFQGATYGGETVFEDVRQVDCDRLHFLDGKYRMDDRNGRISQPEVSGQSFDGLVEENLGGLRSFYSDIRDCFADNIDTALSGGYDSRLTLALLQEQNVRPNVHVYGKSSDADVRIATAIDKGEELGLQHIDKSAAAVLDQDRFPEVVENNFRVFDGFPTDGIFNNGQDLVSRRQRCESGAVMLNGGGGEVFRNFFYLPDRSFSVQQLLWTFYSQFDPLTASESFDERAYHARLGEKVRDVIAARSNRLARAEVELVYPLFRCRYWMGKNNSINNRLGYALTPFIDYPVVQKSVRIPLTFKNSGRFEAAMIRRVSPALAAYPSDYGFDFVQGAGVKQRLKDRMTLARPPMLRRYLYRIKSRRRADSRPYWLSTDYVEQVMDRKFPYMSRYFALERNRDMERLNRIYTLEYLFQSVNARSA